MHRPPVYFRLYNFFEASKFFSDGQGEKVKLGIKNYDYYSRDSQLALFDFLVDFEQSNPFIENNSSFTWFNEFAKFVKGDSFMDMSADALSCFELRCTVPSENFTSLYMSQVLLCWLCVPCHYLEVPFSSSVHAELAGPTTV